MIKYHPVTIDTIDTVDTVDTVEGSYSGQLIVSLCGMSLCVFNTEVVPASKGRGFLQGEYHDGRFTVGHTLSYTFQFSRAATVLDVNPNDLYDMRAVC